MNFGAKDHQGRQGKWAKIGSRKAHDLSPSGRTVTMDHGLSQAKRLIETKISSVIPVAIKIPPSLNLNLKRLAKPETRT